MKKILFLLALMPFAYRAVAQQSTMATDTILIGSIEKNYPGGFKAFQDFVTHTIHPSSLAFENKKVGTTYVSFIIETDGSVNDVCTIHAADWGMDEEGIRVINKSKNWIPATIDNKPVRCFCRVAFKFSADFSKNSITIKTIKVD